MPSKIKFFTIGKTSNLPAYDNLAQESSKGKSNKSKWLWPISSIFKNIKVGAKVKTIYKQKEKSHSLKTKRTKLPMEIFAAPDEYQDQEKEALLTTNESPITTNFQRKNRKYHSCRINRKSNKSNAKINFHTNSSYYDVKLFNNDNNNKDKENGKDSLARGHFKPQTVAKKQLAFRS